MASIKDMTMSSILPVQDSALKPLGVSPYFQPFTPYCYQRGARFFFCQVMTPRIDKKKGVSIWESLLVV